ncbi:hypothetical protein DLAC_07494 [Tieghemostelium lacteum]|uniref:Uncharacterized protein n=1 Tax=Tieghemostelium lacteum TaxID=361077 RepID=A0A151ZCN3_TIELA|nr:hypothetical protein DLAC_07494 [Tieghemostelium lacteum]|eukprot:KYQ91712.1 hypothetical protein DLAC_07494 [Tieghemostelium lacteum]
MDSKNSNDILLFSEISPSFAMKITSPNGENTDDIWADNIEDGPNTYPSTPLSCSLGHNYSKSPLKDQYYNFNFRMGTPIAGKDFCLDTPTLTHG